MQGGNWSKAGLALKYSKEGIVNFVKEELNTFHMLLLTDIGSSLELKTVSCGQCTTKKVRQYATTGGVCAAGICNKIAQKIVSKHRYRSPSWRNTDATRWCSSPWEIAKCFMSDGGYKEAHSAEETDCSGLLSMIINMRLMRDAQIITAKKIRSARNAVMHSITMEVSDKQLREYIDSMVELLFDGYLADNTDAIKARQKLVRLRDFDENIGQCLGVLYHKQEGNEVVPAAIPKLYDTRSSRQKREKMILYECLDVRSNAFVFLTCYMPEGSCKQMLKLSSRLPAYLSSEEMKIWIAKTTEGVNSADSVVTIKKVESSRGCLSVHLERANDTEDAQPAQKGETEEEGNFQMSAAGKLTDQPQGLDQNQTENIQQNVPGRMSHWHEMENLTPENSLSFKGCFHCIYGLKPPDSILPEGAMGTTKQLMEVQESSGNDTDVNIQLILESSDDDTAISNSGKQALENGNNGENLHEDGENLHEEMIQEKTLSQLVLSTRSILQRSASNAKSLGQRSAGTAKSLGQRSAGTAKFMNQQLVTKMNWELQQETGMSMRLIMGRHMFEPPDSATSHSQFTLERRTPGRKKRKKLNPSVHSKPAPSILRRIQWKETYQESHTIKSRGQSSADNANCMHLQLMAGQVFEPPDIAISPSQFTLGRSTPGRKKGDLILLLYDSLLKVTWIDKSAKTDKKVIMKCTILELKGWLMRLPPRQQEAVCRLFQQFCQALNPNQIQVMGHIMDESSAVDVCLPHNQLQQEGGGVSRDDSRHTGLYFTESHDRAAMTQWIACLTLIESRDESRDKAAIARLTLNPETSGRHSNWIRWNPGLAPLMTGCSAITAVSPFPEQRQTMEEAEIVKWSSTNTLRDMVGSGQFEFPSTRSLNNTTITVGGVQCMDDLIKEQQQEWRECVVPSGQPHPDVEELRECVIIPSGQRHVQRNIENHCFNAVLPLPDLPARAQAHTHHVMHGG